MNKNTKAKKFIQNIDEIDFLFKSNSIVDDVNEYNEFRTAISIDVSSHITKNDPYALALVTNDDLIYHDLYSEENGKLKERNPGHIRHMTENKRLMDVVNVNRKLEEKALGVDLIYHLREFRLIAMVQYKRIDKGVYYASSDRNYAKEIDRMKNSAHKFKIPNNVNDHISHIYFRLNPDPFYLKLCPDSSLTKNKYVSGACLPLDQWDRFMKSEFCQTKSGSNKLEYADLQGRYLKSSEFISLVKRGMLGGYIKDLKQLGKIIIELSEEKHIVVAAIETPGRDYIDQ